MGKLDTTKRNYTEIYQDKLKGILANRGANPNRDREFSKELFNGGKMSMMIGKPSEAVCDFLRSIILNPESPDRKPIFRELSHACYLGNDYITAVAAQLFVLNEYIPILTNMQKMGSTGLNPEEQKKFSNTITSECLVIGHEVIAIAENSYIHNEDRLTFVEQLMGNPKAPYTPNSKMLNNRCLNMGKKILSDLVWFYDKHINDYKEIIEPAGLTIFNPFIRYTEMSPRETIEAMCKSLYQRHI